MNQVKSIICLFLNINKNLFFERWKFLRPGDEKKRRLVYSLLFILSNYVLIWAALFLFIYVFKLNWVAIISPLILVGQLFTPDVNDWQLFFRDDLKLYIPENEKRFCIVLISNMVYKFFVKDGLFLHFLFTIIYFKINLSLAAIGLLGYIFLMMTIFSYDFILKIGSIRLKSICSFFVYIYSLLSTTAIIYLIIRAIISFISYLGNNLNSRENSFVVTFFQKLKSPILAMNYQINLVLIIAFSVILVFSLIFVYLVYLKSKKYYENDEKPRLRLFTKIMKIPLFKGKSKLEMSFLKKDLKLMFDIYKYDFKKYYFFLFLDKPAAFLIAIFLNLISLDISYPYLIFMFFSVPFAITDVSSAMNVKLIANMSFITEYNTLNVMNSNGLEIKKLIDSKLKFFYKLKLISASAFALVVLINQIALQAPAFFIIFNLLIIGVIFIVCPRAYFVNNLIYTRMDYKDYEKYFEESSILEDGAEDFSPLSIAFNIIFSIAILATIVVLVAKNFILITSFIALSLMLVAILISFFIMKRIQKNIVSFVEGGELTADFTKIFKK